jgi:hypothetical protein
LDDLIQQEIATAVQEGDEAGEAKLAETKELLDYAFYVLCFGQFEREVNAVFEAAYQKRSTNPDWTERCGWDLDAYKEATRIPFKDRVAPVIDRRKSAYGKILSDYAKRNHIAHGGLTEPLSSLDAFIGELFQRQSELIS